MDSRIINACANGTISYSNSWVTNIVVIMKNKTYNMKNTTYDRKKWYL
jgi:hypothetical protein